MNCQYSSQMIRLPCPRLQEQASFHVNSYYWTAWFGLFLRPSLPFQASCRLGYKADYSWWGTPRDAVSLNPSTFFPRACWAIGCSTTDWLCKGRTWGINLFLNLLKANSLVFVLISPSKILTCQAYTESVSVWKMADTKRKNGPGASDANSSKRRKVRDKKKEACL